MSRAIVYLPKLDICLSAPRSAMETARLVSRVDLRDVLVTVEPTLTQRSHSDSHSALTFLQFAMPMASVHADCCYSGLYAIDLGSWYFDGGVAPRPRSRVDRPLAPSWALGIPFSSTPPMLRLMTG